MSIVRMGLIGCGSIGRRHAEACATLPEVSLVAVCDVTEDRAAGVAKEHGIAGVYVDADTMMDAEDLEAVLICTPHKAHAAPALSAAERGVHMLVEKPISTSLAEADAMVTAADAAGVYLGAVFQRRFAPAAQRLRQAIDDGRLGSLTSAECVAQLGRSRDYFGRDSWRGTWAGEGGGALMNQAIHMVDMLLWAMGPATEVYGRWATLKHGSYIDVEDTAVATVSFESGALATVQAITTLDPPFGFRLGVHGSSGATVGLKEWPELSQAITDVWTFDGEEELRAGWERAEGGRSGFPQFHRLQIQEFARALQEGREPLITGVAGRAALEVVKAIYLSEERRVPIRLPMCQGDKRAADQLHA